MKTDLYTKIIFTLIAIALWRILIKPIFVSENVRASNQVLDVNIKEIGGRAVSDKILDVNIQKIKGQNFINPALPVKIRK